MLSSQIFLFLGDDVMIEQGGGMEVVRDHISKTGAFEDGAEERLVSRLRQLGWLSVGCFLNLAAGLINLACGR